MSDDLSEFTWIDVDEIHLVGTPANGVPTPVLAKAAEPATDKKGSTKKMSKLEKRLAKALGVDLAGRGASTAADRQTVDDLDRLIRQAGVQTAEISSYGGGRAVFKAIEERVVKAQAAVAAARNEYELQRAQTELDAARRQRFLAKMVARANAQADRRVRPGRFGPNSTDLFGGSSLTLPEDRSIKGI